MLSHIGNSFPIMMLDTDLEAYISVLYEDCHDEDYGSKHCWGKCVQSAADRPNTCFESSQQTRPNFGVTEYGVKSERLVKIPCTMDDDSAGIKYLCKRIK